MHEMAICQALIRQLEQVSAEHGGGRVRCLRLQVGPLSGVEAALLQRAFAFARLASPITAEALLELETAEIVVQCVSCGQQSSVKLNRLLCGHCGSWQTRVTSGDALLLLQVELDCKSLAASGDATPGLTHHPSHPRETPHV